MEHSGKRKLSLSGSGSKPKHKDYSSYRKFSTRIQDYELLTDIGGVDDMSYLYLARHIPTQDIIALRYTDLTISPDYEFVDELIKNERHAALCNHPNILPHFVSFVEHERLWTVTLPVPAGSCRDILKVYFTDGFNENIVATILREVLKAIIYLHEGRMIHNDIRAGNILIDIRGNVRITGLRQLAFLAQNGEYQKTVFSLVGDNIEWAAPEVIAQNANYNEKADIYSIGITALELAFNQTPFDDWPPLKVLLSKLEYDCPAITKKKMSKQFYSMVAMCLQKDPELRPSAVELLLHPFFKLSKPTAYLKETFFKKSQLSQKKAIQITKSPPPSPTRTTPIQDTSPPQHSPVTFSNESLLFDDETEENNEMKVPDLPELPERVTSKGVGMILSNGNKVAPRNS